MDKEDFLVYTMQLLDLYIKQDKQAAIDALLQLGVPEDEVQSVLYTINNMSIGYV